MTGKMLMWDGDLIDAVKAVGERVNVCVFLSVWWLCVMSLSPVAQAQVSPSVQDIIDRQNRQFERLEQQRLERERQRNQPDVRLQATPDIDQEALIFDEPNCFMIQRITLVGEDTEDFQWALERVLFPADYDTEALSDAEREAKSALLGKCYGVKAINIVMRRLQNLLVEKGYITTRVLAGPQDLQSGELVLTVVPGRIHEVRFEGENPPSTLALPFGKGDVLNLRDIEQALENLRRVPSVVTDFKIAPTAGAEGKPGYSDVIILWQQGRPWRVGLSVDDAGSEATGLYQGNLTLSYDNPFGVSDLVSFTYGTGIADVGSDDGESESMSLNYSVPFGYWQVGLFASDYEYQQSIDNLVGQVLYSGKSQSANIDLSRLVYRDQTRKFNVKLSTWWRRSSNHIEDVEIETQRRRTAGFETAFVYRQFIQRATLDVDVAYRKGTGFAGAEPSPEDRAGSGSARAGIWRSTVNLNLPFAIGKQPIIYHSQWRHQQDRTAPTTQDYFSIGGRATVRGYDSGESLSDRRGWYVRNTVELLRDRPGHSVYFGLDYGQVSGGNNLNERDWLSGGAFGFKGRAWGVFYDIVTSWPIKEPHGFDEDKGLIQFNLSTSF